jgi:hypothetical protein
MLEEIKVNDFEALDQYLILVYIFMKHLGMAKAYQEAIELGEKL